MFSLFSQMSLVGAPYRVVVACFAMTQGAVSGKQSVDFEMGSWRCGCHFHRSEVTKMLLCLRLQLPFLDTMTCASFHIASLTS